MPGVTTATTELRSYADHLAVRVCARPGLPVMTLQEPYSVSFLSTSLQLPLSCWPALEDCSVFLDP
jgi:hypothetical protein